MSEPFTIEHRAGGIGGWLEQRRGKIALWIAVIEAILIAVTSHVSRWTVLLLAIVAGAVYAYARRNSHSVALHQISWIFATSQLLALVAVVVAVFFFWLAFVVAAIFAVVALGYLLFDRR